MNLTLHDLYCHSSISCFNSQANYYLNMRDSINLSDIENCELSSNNPMFQVIQTHLEQQSVTKQESVVCVKITRGKHSTLQRILEKCGSIDRSPWTLIDIND